MKTPTAIALCTLVLSAIASPVLAVPLPDGVWSIISDKDGKPAALIKVQSVGGVVQGVLTASLRGDDPNRLCVKCSGDLHDRKIIGMRVLWGMKPDPNTPMGWTGGSILDPNSGNTYQASMVESADGRTLTVRGFIGVALLGRTQIWHRTP
jgi:uncharacterized protein (DUF2147 family)